MNSVAGNKERLAVSTRGKKYGVSCHGDDAEARYRSPLGRGPPFPARCGPALRRCGRGAPAGLCVRGACTPASPSECSVFPFRAIPAALTFAAFVDFQAELSRKAFGGGWVGGGRLSMNPQPFLEIISLERGEPSIYL